MVRLGEIREVEEVVENDATGTGVVWPAGAQHQGLVVTHPDGEPLMELEAQSHEPGDSGLELPIDDHDHAVVDRFPIAIGVVGHRRR